MATTWRSPFGLACPECNASLIAPNGSRYVSNHEVYHFWSCEDCGHQTEMVVDFRINVSSKPSESIRTGSSLVG
jgi:RNase P subunit RPR2